MDIYKKNKIPFSGIIGIFVIVYFVFKYLFFTIYFSVFEKIIGAILIIIGVLSDIYSIKNKSNDDINKI